MAKANIQQLISELARSRDLGAIEELSVSQAQALHSALSDVIHRHAHQYYVLDEPTISDAEYDNYFHALLQLESQFPQIDVHSSPSQRVGAPPLDAFKTVVHKRPMLSLDNAFNDEDLASFDRRIKDRLKTDSEIDYVCEPN